MNWQNIAYFVSVLATIALTGLLAWLAWKQRSLPGCRYFFWLATAMSLMALGEAFSMLSPTQALALFWFKTRFLPLAVIPPLWLLFVLEYSGRAGWITKRLISGLFAIPLITQIMVWTDSLQGAWIRQEVGFYRSGSYWIADVSQRLPGLWYLMHTFTSLILMLAGSALLLRTAWRNAHLYRLQGVFLAASALVPVVSAVVTTFNLLPKGISNPTVPGLALAALLAAMAVFHFDFLKKRPALHERPVQPTEVHAGRSLAIFLLVFGLMAACLVAFGIISYQNYRGKFHHQVEKQLTSISDLKVKGIVDWLTERQANANILRQNPVFSSLVQAYFKDPSNEKSGAALQAWLKSMRENYQYERVFLLDNHSVERISSPDSPEMVSADLISLEQEVLDTGQVRFLDFHRDTPAGPIHLTMLVPIYADESLAHPLGMLVLRMTPETYLYPYLNQWPAPSQTAETLLVRRDGADVLFLNPLRFQPQAALNLRIPLTETEVLAVKAVIGQDGVVQGSDYRGQTVIGAITRVPDSPWFLVARMDLAEADAPLKERLWLTLLFFGSLILASGAGLTALWRKQRLQYYRSQANAAEALRESEDKFKYIFDFSTMGKSITLPTGEVQVNKAFCEMLGYSPEELNSKKWQDLTLPDDIATNERELSSLLSGEKEAARFIKRYLHKNGSVVWGDVSTSLRRDKDAKPLYFLTSVVDITERKQAEEDRQRSEILFRTLFELSPDAIMIIDPHDHGVRSRIIDCNAAACRMNGYQRDELIGQSIEIVNESPYTEAGETAYLDRIRADGDIQLEVLHRHKSGAVFPVEVSTTLIMVGERELLIGIDRDITERKQAEAALKQSEEKFRVLTEAAVIGIYIIQDGKMAYVNPSFASKFGYSPEEIMGSLSPRDLIHPDDIQAVMRRLGERLEGQTEKENIVYRAIKKDGSSFLIEVFGVRVDYQGRPAVMGTLMDATGRWEAEQALRESEHRFHEIFENMSSGVVVYEAVKGGEDFTIKNINRAAEKIDTISRESVLGKTVCETFPGVKEFGLFTILQRVWKTGTAEHFPATFYQDERMSGWRENYIARLPSGEVVVVYDDVTERQRAAETLEEERTLLRTLIDQLPDLIYVKDLEGRKIISNISDWKACGGKSMEDVIGKTDFELYPPELAKKFFALDRQVIDSGIPLLNYEEPGLDALGNPVIILTTKVPLRDGQGKIKGLVGVGRDITERKRSEEAQRENQARLDLALQAAHMGVWDWDILGDRHHFDEQTCRLLGINCERFTGEAKEFFTVVHPDDREVVKAALEHTLEEGTLYDPEYRVIWPDKSLHYITARGMLVRDESGHPVRINGLIWDITGSKQAELELTRQAEEIARLYRASGSLLTESPFDLPALAQTILKIVLDEFGQSNCSLFLVDNYSEKITRIAVAGSYTDQVSKVTFTLDGSGLVPSAIRSGNCINTKDVRTTPAYVAAWDMARSELTIPLKVGNNIIGAIDIQSALAGFFSEDDERLMAIFAERAALAIEHARLYAQTERRLENLTALRMIDTAIASSFDIRFTLGILLDQVSKQLGIETANIMIFNPNTQTIQSSVSQGFRTSRLGQSSTRLPEHFARQVVRERRTIAIENLTTAAEEDAETEDLVHAGFTTYLGVPLVAKGLVKGVLEIYQGKPISLDQEQHDFLDMLAGQAAIAIDSSQLFENLQGSNIELMMAYDETIEGWSQAMDLRDKETEGHSKRVTEMTVKLAASFGATPDELIHIRRGALLHDIGKLGVPDEILRKPGPLTDEEWVIMRNHPQAAYDMLAPITYLHRALDIPFCHHEKWDGSGYPRGIRGNNIPLAARVFAVADVWDALTSDRPYRDAWPK